MFIAGFESIQGQLFASTLAMMTSAVVIAASIAQAIPI